MLKTFGQYWGSNYIPFNIILFVRLRTTQRNTMRFRVSCGCNLNCYIIFFKWRIKPLTGLVHFYLHFMLVVHMILNNISTKCRSVYKKSCTIYINICYKSFNNEFHLYIGIFHKVIWIVWIYKIEFQFSFRSNFFCLLSKNRK